LSGLTNSPCSSHHPSTASTALHEPRYRVREFTHCHRSVPVLAHAYSLEQSP
jgi:hypothetical protein